MPQRVSSVLVTGGATGIGYAAAVALARAGVGLTLVGRRIEALESAAGRLAELGATVEVRAGDMGDAHAPAAVVDAHVERFGGIDAFVGAAGAWESTPLLSMTAEGWDATLDVHLRGAVLGAGAAARHMTAAGRGRIVLVSSVNGYASEPHTSAYSSAKTAVVSVIRSLAVELADSGVTANAVAPGWVATPMTDADLAAAVAAAPQPAGALRSTGRDRRDHPLARPRRAHVPHRHHDRGRRRPTRVRRPAVDRGDKGRYRSKRRGLRPT